MTSTQTLARRVALIGYGALGQAVAQQLRADSSGNFTLCGVLVHPEGVAAAKADQVPHIWDNVDALITARPDVVIEVAGQGAVEVYLPACLLAGIDVVLASIGALMDAELKARLDEASRRSGARLVLPAGALGGLDYLRACRRAGPVKVCYRGVKPPKAWLGTDAEQIVDLAALKEPTTFYRGSAQDAARRFPKNANVVATVALAIGDPSAVEVELVADPTCVCNSHTIESMSITGNLRLTVENAPSDANPKSSAITAFSVVDAMSALWAPREDGLNHSA